MIEEAKGKANEEGAKIVAAARSPRPSRKRSRRAKPLRDQAASLAVKGAEQILRREVDAKAHADLLGQLKADL